MEALIWIGVIVLCVYLGTRDSSPTDPHPPLNPHIICPYCQTKGAVTTRQVKKKVGIHGGKATAAVLTIGWSLLATGLSRKEMVTEARCTHCGASWTF